MDDRPRLVDDRPRLGDRAVGERMARLDDVLVQLEQAAGPIAEMALDAVAVLAEIYGEALARVMTCAARDAALTEALTGDELIRHLLVLHDIHPAPVAERVRRALDDVRPYVRSHGGDVELAGIGDGVAQVRLSGSCDGCPSSSQTLQLAVEQAVLSAAPELSRVEPVPAAAGHASALIPAESLLRRPAAGDAA